MPLCAASAILSLPLSRDSWIWLWENLSKEQLLASCTAAFSLNPGWGQQGQKVPEKATWT